MPGTSTVDAAEIQHFDSLSDGWWDADGSFSPLHQMNPVRVGFIRDHVCRRFGRDPSAVTPLAGLSVVDVGCGGGLLAEPMARLGATTTGVDASGDAIAAARAHASQGGLSIDYHTGSAEELAAAGNRFDVVLALEIVEHVADIPSFVDALGQLVRPGGLVVMSTLNRTAQSYAVAIIGAEYILRWVARGTHDWRKFVRPSELARALRNSGLTVAEMAGMRFDPVAGDWRLSQRNLSVNYIVAADR